MAALVPDTHDFVDGVSVSSEMNTYVRDPIRFLLNKPAAKLRQATLQSIGNGVFVPITFDIEELDDDPGHFGGHSTSVNTSRFTASYSGWYRCDGCVGFAGNATGVRVAAWYVNGTSLSTAQALAQAATSGPLGNKIPARGDLIYLNINDYLELQAFQTSGGALNTNNATGEQSSMAVSWDRN